MKNLLIVLASWAACVTAVAADSKFHAISYLGGSGDSVQGAVILADGTVVLAANVSTPGLSESETGGMLLWLDDMGSKLVRYKRVADEVRDLSTDGDGNLFVAAGKEGAVKLDPAGESVWKKDLGGLCGRIDVAEDGHVVALRHDRDDDSTPGPGRIFVFGPEGKETGAFAGYRHTLDICIDSVSKTVIQIGWRQDRIHDGKRMEPVQVAYVRGMGFNGEEKYLLYDWEKDREAAGFLNRPTNNMADTRGYRCALDAEGRLICAFESAGGNHIFRYEPRLEGGEWVSAKEKKPKGDAYHSFHNSRSEHKTVVTRHEPGSGNLLAVQEFTARLENGRANAARVKAGALAGGLDGSLLFGGAAASGLPVTLLPEGGGDQTSGSYVAALSQDLDKRLLVTRIQAGGSIHAIASRMVDGKWIVAVGGQTDKDGAKPLATLRPLQAKAPGSAGFFAVMEVLK